MRRMKPSYFLIPLSLLAIGAGCSDINPPADKTDNATIATTKPVAEPKSIPREIIIFVSDTCPHCAIVESQVKNGQMDKALPISFKEVSDDANLRLFVEKAKICKLNLSQLGVPMLWDGSNCRDGQDKIQAYLGQLMKIYENKRSAD